MSDSSPQKNEKGRIWCPKCEYKPTPEDRWDCLPKCGTRWHTFWTRGVCPTCGVAWPKTQCPACGVVSPHAQWYHEPEKAEGDANEVLREISKV